MLNDRQVSVCQKGIAVANEVLPRIEYLSRVAAQFPELQPRVDQIRTKRDFLYNLSNVLLQVHRDMKSGG